MQTAFKSRAIRHHVKKSFEFPIGAFDIETVPPIGKSAEYALFGDYADGFLKYEDDNTFYRARTMKEMLEIILKRPNVILYAHNAKGYEFNYLIDEIREMKLNVHIIMQGESGIIGMIIDLGEEGKIDIRDSLALIPMGLGKATKAFQTPTQKGDIGLQEGEIYDPDNQEHVDYCKSDVQSTIEIVQAKIQTTFDIFGCGVGYSAASTAMSAWKTTIPKGHSYWRMPHHFEKFCREGYYGGFVYPGHDIHIHEDVISIDRNAAYAAAMRCGVPTGKPRYVTAYEEGKPGMYECFIKADKSVQIPCIPHRKKNILEWPIGRFKTIITSMEIDFARSKGYDIRIEEGLVWDQFEYPFNIFLDLCEDIEMNEPDKKPSVKLDRNSLYGKFGSKFEVKEICLSEDFLEDDWIPLVDEDSGIINFFLWTRNKENDAEYINPHWAAWITAYERLWMFETMVLVGMEHVRYGDTDSVKADGFRVNELIQNGSITISNKYGDCKIDEEYDWFQCLGPKVYHGLLTKPVCKKPHICPNNNHVCRHKMRAKGIPSKSLSGDLFEQAYLGNFPKTSFVSSNGTFVRMKNPLLIMQKEVSRCMTNFRESQTWKVDENGLVHQPYVEE